MNMLFKIANKFSGLFEISIYFIIIFLKRLLIQNDD